MRGNRVCSLLDIRYPILAGGMTWVSEAVLAAAVSEAGGLGCIATGCNSALKKAGRIQIAPASVLAK